MASTAFENDDDIEPGEDSADSVESSTAAPIPAKPIDPVAAAYLQKKIADESQFSKNKANLEAAQQQANKSQLIAGLSRSFGQLAHSTYGNKTQLDESAYDAMDKAAQDPVKQEQAREALQGEDPNSDSAKQLRQIYKPIFDKAGIPSTALDGLGADQIKAYAQNPLEFVDKQKTLETTKAAAAQAAQDARDDKADEREEARDKKATDAQDKAYTTMRKDLESFRGNQSVQQAATAVQNADKALALVQSVPTQQNLSLLADEMGKVAMGGVPGEHGTQALMPNNLFTKIAELRAWVTGHPNASAADVKEYLQNNKEYLNQVKDISQKAISNYRRNIGKGYKSRVSEDQYNEAISDYNLGGDAPSPDQPGQPSQPAVPKSRAGAVVLYKGKHYRVGSDGDSLEPI